MSHSALVSERVEALLSRMTLPEKAGQMSQFAWLRDAPHAADDVARNGHLGSILNAPDREQRNRLQRIAVEESRLGIPLIFGRDVIHGFRTIFPLPIAQAATFNPDLVEQCAAAAASEASEWGVDWTFAPMVDVARDPRWGRVAEGPGEDPYLGARLAEAMVRGFQGRDPKDPTRVAACAKHFAGYGASESGKDYNTTWLPEPLLREVHLPPFKAAVDAGVLTLMSAFSDLNGLPASANPHLMREILKDEWGFDGFVVSDWGTTHELLLHGVCEDTEGAALLSARAGLDMEMAASTYIQHLPSLVESGRLTQDAVDEAVRRILLVKERLGLFDRPYTAEPKVSVLLSKKHLELAERAARESFVLLENDGVLPLSRGLHSLAVIGCLADDGKNQLGCWAYDGDAESSVTPLAAVKQRFEPNTKVLFEKGITDPRSTDTSGFAAAERLVESCDAALVILGEHWNISGECRSRAFLDLPGVQGELLEQLARTGTPLVLVVFAGRPLTLGSYIQAANATLFAFHPGTMTGPALVDVLFGEHAPSGKLPMTFPRTVGQIPIYYATKNGGRPPSEEFKGIPEGTPLDPKGFDISYLDVEVSPLYPFGFGRSYTTFSYDKLVVTPTRAKLGELVTVECDVTNTGTRRGCEVAQLYVRDLVGSLTRPVRELKGFERLELDPGETKRVRFTLSQSDLSFYGPEGRWLTEPGRFQVFVGSDSRAALTAEFELAA